MSVPSGAQLSLEVGELISRYNLAFDLGEPEAWVATFAADAIFDTPGGVIEGHAALREFCERRFRERGENPGRNQHVVGNLIVRPQGPDRAIAASYLYRLQAGDGGPPSALDLGCYRDELYRSDVGWLFTRRQSRSWPPPPGLLAGIAFPERVLPNV